MVPASQVFRGENRETDPPLMVAIKVFKHDARTAAHEARMMTLAGVHAHQNVVQLLHFEEAFGFGALVMEAADGPTPCFFDTALDDLPMPPAPLALAQYPAIPPASGGVSLPGNGPTSAGAY